MGIISFIFPICPCFSPLSRLVSSMISLSIQSIWTNTKYKENTYLQTRGQVMSVTCFVHRLPYTSETQIILSTIYLNCKV